MILTPSRDLWTLSDWLALFTAGKGQRDPSTGKRKRLSTGKRAHNTAGNSACCCDDGGGGPAPWVCPRCTVTPPNIISASITAPTPCSTCTDLGDDEWGKHVAAIPSGTYQLVAVEASTCLWRYAAEHSEDIFNVYDNSACTGTVVRASREWGIDISKNTATTWTVSIVISGVPTSFTFPIFCGQTTTGSNDCTSGFTTNAGAYACADSPPLAICGINAMLGTGGSVGFTW